MLVEAGVSEAARPDCAAAAMSWFRPPNPWAAARPFVIDHRRGILVGGSDPRKDGLALGI